MKLRSYITSKRLFRHLAAVALLSWPMFTALVSLAEERKFLVILANMPRSFPAEPSPTGVDLPPGWAPGVPPIAMPGTADIEYIYYSHDPEDEMGSFAEFWEEISCGIVRVTGKAIGIVELPWPQYPVFENETTTDDMVEDESIHEDFSPDTGSNGLGFFDLNNTPNGQFGEGEEVREFLVYYETDFDNTKDADELDPQAAIPDNDIRVSGATTEDLDGDGTVDLGVEDLDLDTFPDLIPEDRDGNCILNFVSEDCFCGNCDEDWDPDTEDCNDNGQEDFLFEDIDGDGHLDAGEACLPCLPGDSCLEGDDGNMHADVNCDGELSDNEDLDRDGNFDVSNEDTNANCTCAGHGTPDCDPDEIPGFNPPFYWPVFTPGERFRDLDGDLYYDAIFEPATILDSDDDGVTNCYSQTNANLGDVDDFNDTNGIEGRSFPEPLEDFLVMKVSNEPGQAWYAKVTLQYIRDNYPGNVPMLINRIGNNNINKERTGVLIYDSPDYWIDMQTADDPDFEDYRKLEQDTFSPTVPGHTVPRPSWVEDFWRARYGNFSADELAMLPDFGWVFDTPNLVEYEPVEDSEAGSDEYAFQADVGGTSGWGTVLEQMLHLHTEKGALEMFDDLEADPDGTLGNGAIFDYNCGGEHVYAWLEIPEDFPPVATDDNSLDVPLADDYIFEVADDGRSGCIMPEGAEPMARPDCCDLNPTCCDEEDDGCSCALPEGTWGCDFDMDGDVEEVGDFGPPPTWLPTAVPGSPGGMQDFDGDGQADDFMFDPCAEIGMAHPDCDPQTGLPIYPFPFSLLGLFPPTSTDCACVAFDVGSPGSGAPDFNAECDPANNGCWIDPDLNFCPAFPPDPDDPDANVEGIPCFVPRCTPDEGGSPYYPIPRFTAPEEPSCDVDFRIRWGNGRLIEDPPGGWDEGDDGDPILPPADLVYDGPKEYDDLASSFYHTRWVPGSPFNPEEPVAILLDYGGDKAFGEVTTTSPDVADRMSYGHDKAALGSDGSSHDPDGVITPSGPLSGGDSAYYVAGGGLEVGGGFNGVLDLIHGGPGFDGGNQLILEYMTWRRDGKALTEPLAGPPTVDGRGFRDFNLDGMLDLGEGRQFAHTRVGDETEFGGTENYVIDSLDFTTHDGMDVLAYPFNRDRLIEDVIEATDPFEDYDTWVNGPIGCLGASTADISHITFLPEGLPDTAPFAVTSPSATMPIITVDRMPPEANQRVRLQDMISPPPYTFPNMAASLDRNGETNQGLEPDSTFNVAFAAHEFGHYWECWPDLYDYDVFDGFENEHPIGAWDLMSGSSSGLVHVIPVFKENSGWIQSIDLTTLLIPGVPQELRLGPIESSCDQYYYYENLLRADSGRQERFYFFHLEDHGEFSSLLPWDVPPMEPCDGGGGSFKSGGMMLLHTDLAANSEGVPAQQRIGSHFTYLYEQADGQHSLEVTINAGGNTGDAGDPFPGFCNVTEWSIDTNPDNSWWDSPNDDSGIELIDIRNELSGSQATFLWFPKDIPTLQFVQPPGGRSIGNNFPLIVRWSDQHAGTGLTIFAQRSEDLGVDELGICSGGCFGGIKVNLTPLTKPAPGTAFDTIQVPLGPGTPPPGFNRLEQDGLYRFYAFLDPRYKCPANDGGCENLFSPPVAAASNEGEGMLAINNVVLDVNNPDSTRLEAWIVTFVGSAECDGNGEWQVEGTVSGVQRADPSNPASPLACASTGGQFTTQNPNGAVTFTITNMGSEFVPGDRFIFVTTGFTTYSASVEVQEGEIDPGPEAIIMASSTQSPCCFPPVVITFDGSESTDSDDNSGSGSNLVAYEWDLHNDGTVDATGRIANFTFNETGLFEVRLTVSEGEPNFRTGSAVRTVEITNNRPIASFTATPNVGPSDLLVHFDASDSFDLDGDIVKYAWDFDYTGENCCDCPFSPDAVESDPQIDRIFPEGSFSVALRVTDDVEDESCVTTLNIHSGNQPPAASFTATPQGGQVPLTVVFDASASSDPDGDTLSYKWNFEDDDSTVGPSDDPVVQHTFTEVNETGWRVTLTVDDGSEGDAGIGIAEKQIITTLGEGNTVAITQVAATPSIGPSPLTVSFSATATSQNPGPLTYRWELDGQGTLKFGRNVTHTYINNGEEAIEVHPKLIVTDDTGAQAVRVLDVTVLLEGDEGPVDDPNLEAVLSVVGHPDSDEVSGMAPFLVEFSTEGSRAIDGTAVTVEVDFGDGTPPVPGLANGTIRHTYSNPGEYQATATTITGDGRRETSAPITIIVTQSSNPIAVIFVDHINGDAPLAIRFDGTASFDPEGQSLSFEWDFGDGTPRGAAAIVGHTFNVADQYTITLTVRDASGATGSALLVIVVGQGALTNDPTGIGTGDGDDTDGLGPGQTDVGTCGLGCGPMGAAQLLLMLLGMMSMKYTLRRRS